MVVDEERIDEEKHVCGSTLRRAPTAQNDRDCAHKAPRTSPPIRRFIEFLLQLRLEKRADVTRITRKVLFLDTVENRVRRGGSDRVTRVGIAVRESANPVSAVFQDLIHLLANDRAGERE